MPIAWQPGSARGIHSRRTFLATHPQNAAGLFRTAARAGRGDRARVGRLLQNIGRSSRHAHNGVNRRDPTGYGNRGKGRSPKIVALGVVSLVRRQHSATGIRFRIWQHVLGANSWSRAPPEEITKNVRTAWASESDFDPTHLLSTLTAPHNRTDVYSST